MDAETIGQSIFKCPIVNFSFIYFEWERFLENPYTFDELMQTAKSFKLDIKDQMRTKGRSYTKKDIEFWEKQGPEALKQLKPSTADISTEEFVEEVTGMLGRNKKPDIWWSRSNAFDPLLLQREFEDHSSKEEFDSLLPFWGVRDFRTWIDSKFSWDIYPNGFCPYDDKAEWERTFVRHDSRADTAADILRLQKIEQVINS